MHEFHTCVSALVPVCTCIHSGRHEHYADFSFQQLFRERHTRWAWVCYMTEQPPHQKVIITESIMWYSPGEGTAPRPARWAMEECILLQSREQTWAASCQAVEPREQMAPAQPPPNPAPWLPGKKPWWQGSCDDLRPFTRLSCTLPLHGLWSHRPGCDPSPGSPPLCCVTSGRTNSLSECPEQNPNYNLPIPTVTLSLLPSSSSESI